MIKILYPQLSYTPHLSYEQVWQFLCSLPVQQIEDMAVYIPQEKLTAHAWHRNVAEFLAPLSRPESVPPRW